MISGLQHDLKALGFIMCLTTRELRADGLESNVGIGFPNRWETENGMYCIYDEYGHPWIAEDRSDGGLFRQKVEVLIRHYTLQRGCYVCHSHDGPDFLHRQIPSLARQYQTARI